MKKLNLKKLISGIIIAAMAISMLPTLQVSAKETTTVTVNANSIMNEAIMLKEI